MALTIAKGIPGFTELENKAIAVRNDTLRYKEHPGYVPTISPILEKIAKMTSDELRQLIEAAQMEINFRQTEKEKC